MSTDERTIEALNQGRLLREASVELIPLLLKKREAAIAVLVSEFRAGRTELVAQAAKLAVIDELMSEITKNNEKTGRTEAKLMKEAGE